MTVHVVTVYLVAVQIVTLYVVTVHVFKSYLVTVYVRTVHIVTVQVVTVCIVTAHMYFVFQFGGQDWLDLFSVFPTGLFVSCPPWVTICDQT